MLESWLSKKQLRGMDPITFASAVVAGYRLVPHPIHVFICVADHFEPDWKSASTSTQDERVARWVNDYPYSVEAYSDSRGRPPQHTFFCPIECYRPEVIEDLSQLVWSGYGDIEVHLHHEDDYAERLRELLQLSIEVLHSRHGLLSKDRAGAVRYGFIHGNWALDNSHPEGRWCGVNNEITVLLETGCYADFTMPAAPDPAQTRTINSIYYAVDDPNRPKSHDTGIPSAVGHVPPADGLLMIQGPLMVRQPRLWKKPRLENGNLSGSQPPSARRFVDWLRADVKVSGHDSWVFIKLHTHGAPERNAAVLLGPEMQRFHEKLNDFSAHRGFEYYYVTAREMAQLVKQAEAGQLAPDFDSLGWD
jgi:hypothetical protein